MGSIHGITVQTFRLRGSKMTVKIPDDRVDLCIKAECSFFNKEEQTCNTTYSEYWKREHTPEEILRELKIGRCPNMYWYYGYAVVK